jgi:hypothetical protein
VVLLPTRCHSAEHLMGLSGIIDTAPGRVSPTQWSTSRSSSLPVRELEAAAACRWSPTPSPPAVEIRLELESCTFNLKFIEVASEH